MARVAIRPRCSSLFLVLASTLISIAAMWATVVSGQGGFVSIVCGSGGDPYTDHNGIEWVSDAPYIHQGLRAPLQIPPPADLSKPLSTVRYFPGSSFNKYCYTIPSLNANNSYSLRATFLYGNYDNRSELPSFDLIIDSDYWSVVDITGIEAQSVFDIYVRAKRQFISVCLGSTGKGTPFISTLELRPLQPAMYKRPLDLGYALYTIYRTNYGASTPDPIRYPADQYDRIWYADTSQPVLNTNRSIQVGGNEQPPSAVLQTALITRTPHDNITLTFPGFGRASLHIMLYFAEIGNVTRQGERVFNIHLNRLNNASSPWFPTLDVFNISGNALYRGVEANSTEPDQVDDHLVVTLSPLSNSTLGPFVGAAELLKYSNAPQRYGTNENDVAALRSVQIDFNLSIWTGDPCLPSRYMWDWLRCSSDNTPRITALLLSRRSLSGVISMHIDRLTELTEISLDNNELTGPIPSFGGLSNLATLDLHNNHLNESIPQTLTTLKNLSALYLQNNNLSGEIPPQLLERASSADGNFIFNYAGNPLLRCNGSEACASPPSNLSPAPSPDVPAPSSSGDVKQPSDASGTSYSSGVVLACSLVAALASYSIATQRPD